MPSNDFEVLTTQADPKSDYEVIQDQSLTIPSQPAQKASPSTLEAVGRGASQGATMGFGDELSAAAGALLPTATDEALNRSYGDRYSSIRDTLRTQNQTAQSAHPAVSAVSEILSSLPATIATGAGLSKVGLGAIAQAGAQGSLYGLGKSNKESTEQTLKDTASSGLLSAGLSKGIGMLSKAFSPKSSEALAELTQKGGDFELKYGSGLKDSFKIGSELQDAIKNPETQAAVSRELNAQQPAISNLIKQTKDSVGQKWAPLMEQHGTAPSDVKNVFGSMYERLKSLAPEGDELAQKSGEALANRIKGIEDQLISQSPSGTLSDVPLKALADAQESLGNIVFQQGAYKKVPAVNGLAKRFFGQLSKAFQTADETAGSGGDLSNINKVFSALYKMEDNKLSGSTLKTLASNPQNTAALKAYDSFIKPFAELSPGVRSALAPELEQYISNDFQKSLLKSQVVSKIASRAPSSTDDGFVGWALKKAYLTGPTLHNLANKAGVMYGKVPSMHSPALSGALSAVGPAIPAAGALTTVK